MSSPAEAATANRINLIFADLRENGRKGLMPFVCAGYPTNDGLGDQLAACARAGASIVEVGFPFSDPIADGPVIASAMHDALTRSYTCDRVFEQVALARHERPETASLGLVAMVSMSIIHRLGGISGFCARAAEAGFDGIIVPDLPLDESDAVIGAASDAGLTCSMLVAPTTPDERAAEIAKRSTGFVYMVARTGITGERSDAPDVGPRVSRLREASDTPIACGFGISTADHVAHVVRHADAAIVGSALIRRLTDAGPNADEGETVHRFVSELVGGLTAAPSVPESVVETHD